jgi:dTDP-4-dehydrorhamnose 3,5-epimerase
VLPEPAAGIWRTPNLPHLGWARIDRCDALMPGHAHLPYLADEKHTVDVADTVANPVSTPVLLLPRRFRDDRGWFSETFNRRSLADRGIDCNFVQDNESFSKSSGTIRGLHFQLPPAAQAKLVRVTRGRVLDVSVDLRRGSPSYGRFVSVELSAENGWQLYIPVGFAHGFCTLVDEVTFSYKVSDYYAPQWDAGLRWDDPTIAVPWPVDAAQVHMSAKDANLPSLKEFVSPFAYDGVPLQPLKPPV